MRTDWGAYKTGGFMANVAKELKRLYLNKDAHIDHVTICLPKGAI